jgi:hypothetical protein
MYARTMADVGVAAHSHRNYRGNGEQRPGMFTRGNRTWLDERDNRPAMLATLDDRFAGLGLGDRVPVVAARRPFRDMADAKVQIVRAARTACPGGGIEPPRGVKCDQCWGA